MSCPSSRAGCGHLQAENSDQRNAHLHSLVVPPFKHGDLLDKRWNQSRREREQQWAYHRAQVDPHYAAKGAFLATHRHPR